MSFSRDLSIEKWVSERIGQGNHYPIVDLVRRWGGFTADAVLDPRVNVFSLPGMTGFIGYRLEGSAIVILGDPICAPENRARLAEAFQQFAQEQGRSTIYFGASQSFARGAVEAGLCTSRVQFGEELIFDPTYDPRKRAGTYGSLVRRKVKQAIREGIVIQEYEGRDTHLERAMQEVGAAWLESRRGVQVHISNVHLFENRLGKRWFYAKLNERIVGVVTLNELQTEKGWLLNHLMVHAEAPNGTSEFLIVSTFEALERENHRFVTVGAVTSKELGEIGGLGTLSTWLARALFKGARRIIDLDGLDTFWSKFHPESYRPIYLLFSRKYIGISELIGLKRVLNGRF
jgi:lysylphosphatidylglycerol synthetase-like protein (DUF2156 family)